MAIKAFIDELSLLIIDQESDIPKDENTVNDILDDIEKLDLEALTTMLREHVSRKVLYHWYKIDLSDFYKSERVTNFKSVAIAGFNPSLQIHSVNFFLSSNAWQGILDEVQKMEVNIVMLKDGISVSYTHLTLPTKRIV